MSPAPAVTRDPPRLLLCAAGTGDTAPPLSPRPAIAHLLKPVPAVSLSCLATPDGFPLDVPLLVGVDDVSKELWLLVVPTLELTTSLLHLCEQREGGVAPLSEASPAKNTMLPLLLCGAGEGEGLKETSAQDVGVVAAMVQLGSTSKTAARLTSSSPPSTSFGDREDMVRRVKPSGIV